MSDNVLNVGIVGLEFGSEFIPIYQKHPNANMYAICQRTREKLDKVGDTFSIEVRYNNYEEMLKDAKLMSPVGCPKCIGGYKGRVGIYEVVRITPALARIIMEEGNSIDIADQARKEGFADLRKSALKKAAAGETSLEEVNRVTTD